jgi:hypothetical protein
MDIERIFLLLNVITIYVILKEELKIFFYYYLIVIQNIITINHA